MPQTLVAISFELAVFKAAAAWAGEPGAPRLAIFVFAVLLGGYTAHGFFHLYLGWRAHGYSLGIATAIPLVVFGGSLIYAKLIESETLNWTLAATSFVLGAIAMLPLVLLARRVGVAFA